jgi:hypothetical protein
MMRRYRLGEQGGQPITPWNVPNAKNWWAAWSLAAQANNSNVTSWTDLIGGITVTNPGTAPTLSNPHANFNGYPAISFSVGSGLTGTVTTIAQPWTIFVVYYASASVASQGYFVDGTTSGNRAALAFDPTATVADNNRPFIYAGGGTWTPGLMQVEDTSLHTMAGSASSNTVGWIAIDGTSRAGTGLTLGTNSITSVTLGCRFSATFQQPYPISDIMFFSGQMSQNTNAGLNQYFRTLYGADL